jgi:hypothetical protein
MMKSIARRIKRLESREVQQQREESTDLIIRLEQARKRIIAEDRAEGREPEGGVRLRIPAFRPASRLCDEIVQRLHAGRDLCWRQRLFDECQATAAEMGRAVTEQERAAAQARCAELELRCQKQGFASSPVFLQNCRDQGWL